MNEPGMDSIILIDDGPESITSPYSSKRDLHSTQSNSHPVVLQKPLIIPILLCLIISFGGFIFGWDVGTIGGIINMKSFKNHFGTIYNTESMEIDFPDILTGLIISIFNIGGALGGIFLAKLGDYIGRKLGITLATTIYMLGIFIQIINDQVWYQFMIGRVICGLGVGCNAVLVPMFISESAPINIRGAMVVLFQVLVTFGILVGNITNFFCVTYFNDSNYSWGIPTTLGLLWAAILLVGLIFVPESAEYLAIQKMNEDSARLSFAKMNGISVYHHKTDDFLNNMQDKLFLSTQERINRKKWHEFISGSPKLGLRVLIGVLLMAFQQLSGINYFFYYGTMLFGKAGMSNPYTAAMILSSVNFLSTFAGIYLVESWGRKFSLFVGSIGMFICMTLYSSIGSFFLSNEKAVWGMIIVTCAYIVFFATTSGPVTFVVVSELYPIRTRALSMALCSATNWIVNFFISLLIPVLTKNMDFFLGYIFSFFLFISIFFIWFMVPETKGKNNDQIDFMFSSIKNELVDPLKPDRYGNEYY
ncbi:Hxt14p PWA37_002478 [Arxiozyma heterogenica]|uniref:Hxt14p n=1 Tax=Arxiozyma heterogenica TaxID=278026 RepID=UPI002F0993CC